MDTRKVQRTGKSTYIVSLPKNWATKNGVCAGSIIFITQSDNGALMLSTDRSERDLKAKLEIGDKSGEVLIRDIIGCYLGGYRTIEVTSSHISSEQKRDLRQIVNKLIGPEILEETISKVVIQDLLSSEELQAQQALKRIKTVVKSMIQDSLTALINCDKDLAEDVIQRDNDVDRLNLLISRQFTEILRSGSVKQEMLSSITAFNYMLAASNLERAADHAHRIADIAYHCDVCSNEKFSDELSRLKSEFEGLVDDSITFLLQMDSERANELIEKIKIIQNRVQSLTNLGIINRESEIRVVTSSIERISDYIMNICELTINLRHATADIAKVL
jgi:phosphate uptake regulator